MVVKNRNRNLIERTQSQKKDLRKNKEKRYYIVARKKIKIFSHTNPILLTLNLDTNNVLSR